MTPYKTSGPVGRRPKDGSESHERQQVNRHTFGKEISGETDLVEPTVVLEVPRSIKADRRIKMVEYPFRSDYS